MGGSGKLGDVKVPGVKLTGPECTTVAVFRHIPPAGCVRGHSRQGCAFIRIARTDGACKIDRRDYREDPNPILNERKDRFPDIPSNQVIYGISPKQNK